MQDATPVEVDALPDSLNCLISGAKYADLTAVTECDLVCAPAVPAGIWQLLQMSSLRFGACNALAELSSSIGQLTQLRRLDMRACAALTALPSSIGRLVRLTHFNLCECAALAMLPASIGQLAELSQLDLRECAMLGALPDSIGMLKQLVHLDLNRCQALTALPSGFGQLAALTTLNMGVCRGLRALPASSVELAKLRELDMGVCETLAALPDSIGQLSQLLHLDLHKCRALAALPSSIGWLTQLTHLDISGCRDLEALPDSIAQLSQLSDMHMTWCSLSQRKPTELKLRNPLPAQTDVGNLLALPGCISRLTKLTTLDLHVSVDLAQLPHSIGVLKQVANLDISDFGTLTTLPDTITQLTQLSRLDMSRCMNLAAPTVLSNLSLASGSSCKVHFHGSKFAQDYGIRCSPDGEPLHSFQDQLRRVMAMQSLLSDRDARRASLDSISVVAVLLATSAFVTFAQAPTVPDAFAVGAAHGEAPASQQATQQLYLRLFFRADMAAFVLSMSVVMLYLESSLPRYSITDKAIAAAQVWLQYLCVSVLLGGAVLAGVLAFFFGAAAVYPHEALMADVLPWGVVGALLIAALAGLLWVQALMRITPGWRNLAICMVSRLGVGPALQRWGDILAPARPCSLAEARNAMRRTCGITAGEDERLKRVELLLRHRIDGWQVKAGFCESEADTMGRVAQCLRSWLQAHTGGSILASYTMLPQAMFRDTAPSGWRGLLWQFGSAMRWVGRLHRDIQIEPPLAGSDEAARNALRVLERHSELMQRMQEISAQQLAAQQQMNAQLQRLQERQDALGASQLAALAWLASRQVDAVDHSAGSAPSSMHRVGLSSRQSVR